MERKSFLYISAAKFFLKIKVFSSQKEINEFLELSDISYIDSETLRFNNTSIHELDSPSLLYHDEDYCNYEDDYDDYEDYDDYVVYEEDYGD